MCSNVYCHFAAKLMTCIGSLGVHCSVGGSDKVTENRSFYTVHVNEVVPISFG